MKKYEYIVLGLCLVLCLSTGVISFIFHISKKEAQIEKTIEYKNSYKVLFDIHRNHRDSLLAGYHYHLLRKFADENGIQMEISLGHRRNFSLVDSLYLADYDLVATRLVPECDSVSFVPVGENSFWCLKSQEWNESQRLRIWLENYRHREEYSSTRELFFRVLNPYRSRSRENLSPYDNLIKRYADSLGWDWRRFAAVIYQESQFHIEAHSRRGARGIMQLMPRTARNYGVSNSLDPEENIAAGSRLLRDLDARYRGLAASPSERFKFTLVAYNAGVGRMRDIIALAQSEGVDTSCWDSLKTLVPIMSDSTRIDTSIVKLGAFNGEETLNYVESVNDIYNEFVRIVR